MASFKNPQNGYTQSVSEVGAFLGCLVFGVFYFAYKGAWKHALISFGAAVCTLGVSWFIYPFFAYRCVEHSYLERGWKRLGVPKRSVQRASSAYPSFTNLP
jgi:hypothetical protein